jgi:hypothetical protein
MDTAVAALLSELRRGLAGELDEPRRIEVFAGLSRAFDDLLARPSQIDAYELRQAIHRLAGVGDGPWHALARRSDWPTPPRQEPLALALFERRLRPSDFR